MSAPVDTSVRTQHLAAPVDVDELKRAWRAVQAGDFRSPKVQARRDRSDHPPATVQWRPEPREELLVVLGCGGSSGATTVSLAMGLSTMVPVRVVECGSLTTSGLAAASTAELGTHPDGRWLQGRRDHVQLQRPSEILPGPHAVPHPTLAGSLSTAGQEEPHETSTSCLTILDTDWEAGQLLSSDSWIADTVRTVDHLVLTTRATTPGMRRLGGVLDLLSGTRDLGQVKVAVMGPRRKKWTRGLEHAGGSAVRRVLDAGNCVEIPEMAPLAVAGLDSRPLPAEVIRAAHRLLPAHQQDNSDRNPIRLPEKGTP